MQEDQRIYTEEFQQEWDRIQAQKLGSKDKKPGRFKIGTVELTVPPAQIAISDMKNNFTYEMMRSAGDVTFQSGHSTKIVELDLIFHSLESINQKLRPLIAQLKCSPFVVIENEYLDTVLNPSGGKTKTSKRTFEDKSAKDLAETIARSETERELAKTELRSEIFKSKFREDPTENADIKNKLILLLNGTLYPSNSGEVDTTKTISEAIKSYGGLAYLDLSNDGLYEKANAYERTVRNTTIDKNGIFGMKYANEKKEGNLAAVFSQVTISTTPGLPEALSCHLTLFIFNYSPFSQKFHFVDRDNKETKNIDECEYFIRWYTARFLSSKPRSLKIMERGFTNNISFEASTNEMAIDKSGKNVFQTGRITFDTSDFSSAECVSISISLSNRIKFLPVISYGVPTCQFLGSNSLEVAMVFNSFPEIVNGVSETFDVFVNSMKYFFDKIDSFSRSVTKNKRRAWVTVDNDLTNFFSVDKLIIQGIDVNTVPGSPSMSNTVLKFIDITESNLEREKITLRKAVTDDRMAAIFDVELARYRDNVSKDMNKLLSDKNISQAVSSNRLNSPLFAKKGSSNEFYTDEKTKDLIEAYKISHIRVDLKGSISDVDKVKAFVGNQGITSGSPDDSFAKETKRVNNILEKKIRESLKEDEISRIPAVYKRLLINTPEAAPIYKKWAKMLEDYDFGYAGLPDEVADVFKERQIDKWKDEAFYTYPDLELMSYADVAPSGSISGMLPSYRDLGIPLYGVKDTTEKARNENDLVEPDFYFYNVRIKDYSTRNLSFDSAVKERGDLHASEGTKIKEDVYEYQKKFVNNEDTDSKEFDKNQSCANGANVDRIGGGNIPDPVDGAANTKFAKNFGNKDAIEAVVERVVDGDTVVLKGIGYARLKGIDTPEKGQPGYEEATQFLRETLEGKTVLVSIDNLDSGTEYRDVYGRALVYISLGGKDINHEVLKNDLAVVDVRYASSRTGTYLDTEGVRTNLPKYGERGFGGVGGELSHFESMGATAGKEAEKVAKDPDGKYDGINIFDQDHLKNLRSYYEQSISDDMFRMVRAFPTYKLYFVEEDNEAENLWDDLYAYNAIESIEVHKSKENAADTAVVTVSNMSGNLDRDLLPRPKEKLAVVGGDVREYQDEIQSMRLKSGQRIMIKMGYSTNVDELTTVFTGKVTSVQYGDMVTFEAQGYGVELLQPKGYDYKASYLGGFEAVPLNILLNLLKSPEVQHFGKRGFGNFLEGGKISGDTQTRDEKDAGLIDRYRHLPQEDNIYINRTNRFLNVVNVFAEFRVYKTTIWEVFQEMTRRMPGNITAVVPYDKRATIFYGLPNQPYIWTDGREIPLMKEAMKVWREGKKLYDYKPLTRNTSGDLQTQSSKSVRDITFPLGSAYGIPGDLAIGIAKNVFGFMPKKVGYTGNDLVTIDRDALSAWTKVEKGIVLNKEETSKIEHSIKTDLDPDVLGKNVIGLAVSVIKSEPQRFNKIFNVKVSGGRVLFELADPKKNDLYIDSRGNIVTASQKLSNVGLMPRQKPFRTYHFKDSFHHIIANNIKINLDDFHNTVIVEFPESIKKKAQTEQQELTMAKQNYKTLVADIDIPEESRRTIVVRESNAETNSQGLNYALGNLLLETQKLYQGNLVILGDPKIKPHDIVFVYDIYNDVIGPIEVREVTHSMSGESGFVTTIVPDLCVNINAPTGINDTLFNAGVFAAIVALGIVATAATGGSLLIASSTFLYATANAGKDIWPLMMGDFGGGVNRREPIKILPLMYNGKPYISGFEGVDRDRWWFFNSKGWNSAWKEVGKGAESVYANFINVINNATRNPNDL